MNADSPRIDRLRALVVELRQSPPSRERDALLRAAGERVVTLETGGSRSISDAWEPRREYATDAQRLTIALLDA